MQAKQATEKPEVEGLLKTLQNEVDGLYRFRDHYFETHPITDAVKKTEDVNQEMTKTLKLFENVKDNWNHVDRAVYYYLRGKTYNVKSEYSEEAENALSKAVKLDPTLLEAWNELGECYWKKGNVHEAKNCFTGALKQGRNKVSLRNLSMVLRQEEAKSEEEQMKKVEQGLKDAKEAVHLDINDGKSWAILGNAYLSSFFTISQNPKMLKLALSAYLQAEKDVAARSLPDLHHNKGIALRYEEEYQLSLKSFSEAFTLDPTWSTPQQKESELLKYLETTHDLVKYKGKLKARQLQQIMQSLNTKDLGPYDNGSYTSSRGETVKLEYVSLSKLQPGDNQEKVILGKVVCSIQNEDGVPFTFCIVDKDDTCMAVTLYNLAEGKGVIIGDSVAIPEPFLTHVHVEHLGKVIDFDSIRVEAPIIMVVNGRKVGRDKLATVRLASVIKSD